PRSQLFPYTTLFRSGQRRRGERDIGPGERFAPRVRGGGEKRDGERDRDEDRDVEVKVGVEGARPRGEACQQLGIEQTTEIERPRSEEHTSELQSPDQ